MFEKGVERMETHQKETRMAGGAASGLRGEETRNWRAARRCRCWWTVLPNAGEAKDRRKALIVAGSRSNVAGEGNGALGLDNLKYVA